MNAGDCIIGFNTVTVATAGSAVYFAMTDIVTVAIVGGCVTVVTSTIGTLYAYKAKKLAEETKKVSEDTHKVVNSQMEAFKKMAEEFFTAKGKELGKAEQKATQAVIDKATAIGAAQEKAAEQIPKTRQP